MRLYLIRHADADGRFPRRYLGSTDLPLTPRGEKEAQAVGAYLAQRTIDRIIASPLKRTRATAAAIAARHGHMVEFDDDLREIDFGEYEGLTYEQIAVENATPDKLWEELDIPFPGGESLRELAARTERFRQKLLKLRSAGTVVVVAHGGALRVLLCQLLKRDLATWWEFKMDNAAAYELTIDEGGAVLVSQNLTDHLHELR